MEESPRFKVNTLIAGAQKSGTTALSAFLSEHPDTCFGIFPECHFFDRLDFPETAADMEYQKSFNRFSGQKIIVDATPSYMYLPQVPQRVFRYNPEMKVIFSLRHPAERAVSQYWMDVNRGAETWPLWLALLGEKPRSTYRQRIQRHEDPGIRYGATYYSRGLYSRQIKRFLALFPRRNLFFFKQEDLLTQHRETLEGIYEFLGLDIPSHIPASRPVRKGDYSLQSGWIMNRILRALYRREVQRLEYLLGWDLAHWK